MELNAIILSVQCTFVVQKWLIMTKWGCPPLPVDGPLQCRVTPGISWTLHNQVFQLNEEHSKIVHAFLSSYMSLFIVHFK